MITAITREKRLKNCLHRDIEDEGVRVNVSSDLTDAEYIGIKVDDYYAGKHLRIIPKAVDFIVAVDCECDWYALYILEFKGIKRTTGTKAIQEKFTNTIEQFMKEEFKDIFLNDRYKYRDVKLYLVTTSYKKALALGKFEEYQRIRERINAKDTLANDSTLSTKLYFFRGKYYRIEREIPPNPLICKIR